MTNDAGKDVHIDPYWGPVGGWGSAKSVAEILLREAVPLKGPYALLHQNKPRGFACVSCSYAKPGDPHPLEFCENGAKATAWEITSKRCGPDFFAEHNVSALESWSDHDLEEVGRLTEPLRYDPESDKYRPVAWNEAFAEIGNSLNRFDPKSVVFYTSGRASLEASYMYQLFARMYGSNNLPDSSNMCHESTSVALPETIGVPIGTVKIEDFDHTDCMFFFGQNVGVSSPRMLHQLDEVRRARRAHHHLQSAARTRARALHQSPVAGADADAVGDEDQHAISPTQPRRRSRGDCWPLQGADFRR